MVPAGLGKLGGRCQARLGLEPGALSLRSGIGVTAFGGWLARGGAVCFGPGPGLCWSVLLLLPGLGFYAVAVGMFTFLFTDVEGSTALLQRVGGDVYARVLSDHYGLIRAALAGHGGRGVDTAGDGLFAVFSSPRACVAAALEMQRALGSHAWPDGVRVRVRMGVHAGEAEWTAAGLVGLDVHRAARIAAVAYGGQVLVSAAAAVLAGGVLPPGAGLRDLGSHRLKDLGRPEQIFQLCAAGLQSEFAPLRSLGNPALRNNLPAQLSAFIGRDQLWRHRFRVRPR